MKRQLEKVTIIHLVLLMIIVVLFTACNNKPTLFKQLPSSQTGIHFNNAIKENDSINPIDLEFLYNGGGVAVGDFNKDGLPDLYFTASTSSNKLYLNKGSLQFEDITRQAGVAGEGRWSNAASVDASMDALFFNPTATSNLFTEVTAAVGINYFNRDPDFIDFNEQRLLPHKLSAYGPALACGDVDRNGLDDIIVSGTGDYPATILLQQSNGKFISELLPVIIGHDVRRPESLGTILFDADNDGDLDLYMASGSNQFAPGTKNYQDWFYTNDGKGNFTFNETAFPKNYTSKSCVKAADFDNDGDLDMFTGGRVLPGKYPLPVSSFIYRNDSKNGEIKFTDVTKEAAPGLQNMGLTCDALWTDFDNAGWTDLVIAGEWMPVQFFKNNQGKFKNVSATSGINSETGWWNSITAGDFDNDGDIDYIAGNLDAAINGNDFGTEVVNGRYDALNGLVLLGDGKGNFSPLTILQSGFFIPGDGKALVKCRSINNSYFLAASQNNGPLKIFSSKHQQKIIPLLPGDKYCIYHFKNGKKRKEEFYTGNSYLSQSSSFITTSPAITSIEIITKNGEKRRIQ